MLQWAFLESDGVLPKALCEVLSRFQKVHETLEMTLAQFYIWTRFGVIWVPLIRLERKFRGGSGFGGFRRFISWKGYCQIPSSVAHYTWL